MTVLDRHLNRVWPHIIREWMEQVADRDDATQSLVHITRTCARCSTTARYYALLPVTTEGPVGSRAFCRTCASVGFSPVARVSRIDER